MASAPSQRTSTASATAPAIFWPTGPKAESQISIGSSRLSHGPAWWMNRTGLVWSSVRTTASSPASMARTTSVCARRSASFAGGSARLCLAELPMPRPSTTRPGIATLRVAIAWAVYAAGRCSGLATPGPIVIRDVAWPAIRQATVVSPKSSGLS